MSRIKYFMFIGEVAIVPKEYEHLPINDIPVDILIEGFMTVAMSEEDAIDKVRNAFNADELEDEMVLKVVITFRINAMSRDAVLIHTPENWELERKYTDLKPDDSSPDPTTDN